MSGIDDDAMMRLKEYAWPGNIRQLENVIERAVVVAEESVVMVDDLPDELLHERADVPEDTNGVWSTQKMGLPSMVQSACAERERREREQLACALAAAGGNKAVAARRWAWRSTLVSRLKRLGLS